MSELSFGQIGPRHYVSCIARETNCKSGFVDKNNCSNGELVENKESGFFNNILSAGKTIKDGVCNLLNGRIIKIFSIFSPLIAFVNNFDSKNSKQVVLELGDTVDRIVSSKELNKLLSQESKQSVERLSKAVAVIKEMEGLPDSEMSELIKGWRESEDTKYLLEMAKRIRSGHCAPFKDRKLKEAFIRSLESLSFALEEISKHDPTPESCRASEKIKQAAHSTVDAVERHDERGGDANFTQEDKRFIGGKLEEASSYASEVVNDPTLSKYLGKSCSCLKSWISYINEFIMNWYQEEKEEAEAKEKKLCKENKLKEKLIFELCRIKCIKEKRAENFYFMMKRAQEKIEEFLRIKSKYCYTKDELEKHIKKYDFAKVKRRCEAMSADFYESKRNEIIDSLSSCYLCGTSLDLLC